MCVNELPLGRVLDQLLEQCLALRFVHAEDAPGVGSEIQPHASGPCMSAHQGLGHGRQRLVLFVGKIGKAQFFARIHDGVLGHQPAQGLFHFICERIVSSPHVSEFGLAADRWNTARVEQRGFRGQAAERTIGMPHSVAHLEHALAAFLAPDRLVGIQVRDVRNFCANAQFRVAASRVNSGFQRAEVARELEVLIGRKVLVREDEHRVAIKRRL